LLLQIPSLKGKKCCSNAPPIGTEYLSSKANFFFNETLFTLFRERYGVMTPLPFF